MQGEMLKIDSYFRDTSENSLPEKQHVPPSFLVRAIIALLAL